MSVAEIGRRLKKARLDAKLTQKEVADKLGITYQAISNYERGTNRVDTDTLSRLCKIYGIAISDLLSTPAWTSEMFDAYRSAKSDSERERYLKLWGTPAELIDEVNNRREPDPNPLTPEDEMVLYRFHRGELMLDLTRAEIDLIRKYRRLDDRGKSAVLNVLNHEYESLPGEKASPAPKEA